MGEDVRHLLDLAQGPVFRFAFALLIFGLIRGAWISFSAASAAYLVINDRREFWRRLGLRTRWHVLPMRVIRTVRGTRNPSLERYHTFVTWLSLIFRFGVLAIPAFMVAHVYLWEKLLGTAWPSIPARISDVLSIVTVASGLGVFLGRIYSPAIRAIDPPWAFFKPLILLVPFVTGLLAMHPTWSPAEYHATRLIHVVSAAVVFVMIPFGRILSFLHQPIEAVLPELAWPEEETPRAANDQRTESGDPAPGPQPSAAPHPPPAGVLR